MDRTGLWICPVLVSVRIFASVSCWMSRAMKIPPWAVPTFHSVHTHFAQIFATMFRAIWTRWKEFLPSPPSVPNNAFSGQFRLC